MEDMRSVFHLPELIMKVEVDKSKFPDYEDFSAIKVKLSTREIYDKMNVKNPALAAFVKEIGLKPAGE
jgi:hypothetical protein